MSAFAPETTTPRSQYQAAFGVLLVAITAFAMLQSLVLPVLPTFQQSLHTSQGTVTWVLTAYLLAASVATPLGGRIGDMVGKKRTLLAVLAIFALGTLLSALATSIAVMIVGRTLQGASGAILPLAFGLVRDLFPRERVVAAVSTAAAVLAVGAGLGVVLAGPIVDALNYHFLFWIPLVFIVGSAVTAHLVIPESQSRTPGRISVRPALFLAGWLVALLVAVSEGSVWGWASGRTLGLFGGSAILIVAWVASELRSSQPVVDMRMMRLPAVWTTNLVTLLFGVGMYAVLGFLPEFLQTPTSAGYGFGSSITASGLFLLPMTVIMFLCGLLSGRLAERSGSKVVLVLGSAFGVVTFALLAFAHDERWEIYLASAMLGAGLGFGVAAMSNIIIESVPASQTGVASGMNANIRTIGGSIGAAVMGSIVTSGAAPSGLPKESGYTHGFLFLFVAGLLAGVAALAIPSARRRAATTSTSNTTEPSIQDTDHLVVRNGEAGLVAGATLFEVE